MRAHRIAAQVLAATGREVSKAERAEMAIPSYTHGNPLVRWLFWSRLDAALDLADIERGDRVLDFASGTGALLPTLIAAGCHVAATDLVPGPWKEHARIGRLDVESVNLPSLSEWVGARAGTCDIVFALDVLEHVEDLELEHLSRLFADLLRADGTLIVSGATETLAYRAARRLAGFAGDYHHRSIFDVHHVLEHEWVETARHSLPPHPLPHGFIVTSHRPRAAATSHARLTDWAP